MVAVLEINRKFFRPFYTIPPPYGVIRAYPRTIYTHSCGILHEYFALIFFRPNFEN